MYTSVVLVALSGYVAQAALVPERPQWLSDYSLACKHGQSERKPLAVIVGTGTEGWQKLSKDGKFSKDARQLLNAHYVCVYVDVSTAAGRQLAESLEITDTKGIVISDRSGARQAFWHDGSLSEEDLQRRLQKYADPDLVVRGTETVEDLRSSYYYQPQPAYYPSFGGGGRGC